MTNKIRFIGDVHGKFERYKRLIKNHERTRQVGDMGVGFFKLLGDERIPTANPPFDAMERGDNRYIRGNHDNLSVCKQQKHWIEDGYREDNIMYIGGAASIDRVYRTEGLSWWADEELSYEELLKLYDDYVQFKPAIMVTHTCPLFVIPYLVPHIYPQDFRSEKAFEAMFAEHRPDVWIFGHWHTSVDMVILGTRFVCLNELEVLDLEV